MTITVYNNSVIQLIFGVPLEDIFPKQDLNPALKKLFEALERSLTPENVRNFLTPNNNEFQQCTSMSHPSTLLSTLRHFLNQLPLPLFPRYTDKKCFSWLELSDKCRSVLEKRALNAYNQEYLIDNIAEQLMNLPTVNLVLIAYMVNFLRSMIIPVGKPTKYNKRAMTALIRYFTSSMFVRSHHTKTEKSYHPLMLYLLIKWPEIQLKCEQKRPVAVVKDSHLETIEEMSVISTTDTYLSFPEANIFIDNAIQTEYMAECASTQTLEGDNFKIDAETQTQINFCAHAISQTSIQSQQNVFIDVQEYFYDTSTPIASARCNEYKLTFEDLSKDEEAESIKIPSSSNLNNTTEFNEAQNIQTPLSRKPRKSFSSISKFLSRVDLFRLLKHKKLTKAKSDECVESNVKYEKMIAGRSLSF